MTAAAAAWEGRCVSAATGVHGFTSGTDISTLQPGGRVLEESRVFQEPLLR